MSADATVLVLAKSPQPGKVKTRLCPPCDPTGAAAVAEAALVQTLAAVLATDVRRRVLVLDGPAGPWLPRSLAVWPQGGGDLATRIAHAFARSSGPTLLVGMDTPQLSPALLHGALRALAADGTDAVLGPASDGGWWALGLRRPDPGALRGVPMSSDRTGAAQLQRLGAMGLRTSILPELLDVDRGVDAHAVAEMVPGTGFAAAVARHVPVPTAGSPA